MCILFRNSEAFAKGFDSTSLTGQYFLNHSSTWPGLWEGLNDNIPRKDFLEEPAFEFDRVSFVLWNVGTGWASSPALGVDDCGISNMFSLILGDLNDYMTWAEENFERDDIPLSSVRDVFNFIALSSELVHSLNPSLEFSNVAAEVAKMGYPIAER